jgi:O-antigen/teichoic acid export membrane protein
MGGVLRNPSRIDIAANGLGFALFAIGALAANLLVARAYGPAVVGVFNQVVALYLVASQVAVLGTHIAALREASLIEDGGSRRSEASALIGGALIAVALPSGVAVAIGYAASFALPHLFAARDLRQAWLFALPGVFFFALNKVLLNLANGFGLFRVFALAQAGRSVLFLSLCCIWVISGWPGRTLPLTLAIAEAMLCVLLIIPLIGHGGVRLADDWLARVKQLFSFGISAAPSVAFGDFNSRIDVIVLGIFVPAEMIGVYTIAAWLIEGAIQLPVAVRPLVNRSLAQAAIANPAELRLLMRKVGGLSALVMAGLLGAICVAYPFASEVLLGDARYRAAQLPLVILSIGAVIGSSALPFDLLLAQTGRPWTQSTFKGVVMLSNLGLALALVPFLGTTGAALAYGTSFVVYAIALQFVAGRILRARI